MSFVLDEPFRVGNLNFKFYDDTFSFPNKLKFNDSNICTKLLVMKQQIIPPTR